MKTVEEIQTIISHLKHDAEFWTEQAVKAEEEKRSSYKELTTELAQRCEAAAEIVKTIIDDLPPPVITKTVSDKTTFYCVECFHLKSEHELLDTEDGRVYGFECKRPNCFCHYW